MFHLVIHFLEFLHLVFLQRFGLFHLQELQLIQDEYNLAIERIIDIKSEINEPLNRYDLIFTHKEDFDPTAAKEKIKDDLKHRG